MVFASLGISFLDSFTEKSLESNDVVELENFVISAGFLFGIWFKRVVKRVS